jgi:hypothetical protein
LKLELTNQHRHIVTSQRGEDGIIAAVFAHLGITKGTAVEFGAWDGVVLSNTAALRAAGWRVCLIEGDRERASALKASFAGNPNVIAIEAYVTTEGPTSLDRLLGGAGIDYIDFLSIDIDGADYAIFESLSIPATLACVEFNPTIPPPVVIASSTLSSSLQAIADLGARKGYSLIFATDWNAFLIRNEFADRFVIKTPAEVYIADPARYVISAQDGRNMIIDASGREAEANNHWTGKPAAIALSSSGNPRRRWLPDRLTIRKWIPPFALRWRRRLLTRLGLRSPNPPQ